MMGVWARLAINDFNLHYNQYQSLEIHNSTTFKMAPRADWNELKEDDC